ncbi:GNAT family N-acetyltransferase [Flexivirga alba]|uniref:GNAT family N-acetyltransferase n=1 Tax=Flexivirga alba TaxID=702742 RepID=A0ABW2AFW2_9MICO
MSSMFPPLADLITRLGRGAASWARPGELDIGHGHWIALTGATQPDFNLAYCSAGHGEQMIDHYLDRLIAHRRPGLLVTTSNLGVPHAVRERGWKLVEAGPLMAARLTDIVARPPDVTPPFVTSELTPRQLPLARDLMARAFDLAPDVAAIALRPDSSGVERHVWGVLSTGEIQACGVSVIDDEYVTLWSVATDPSARRQGQATTLIRAALTHARANGCTLAVLNSSPMAGPFYRALGFRTLDQLSYWSNPRWALAAD